MDFYNDSALSQLSAGVLAQFTDNGLMQQMNCANAVYGDRLSYYGGMSNAYRSPAQRKLDQASVIAAEVRAHRPEMQVKKLNVES